MHFNMSCSTKCLYPSCNITQLVTTQKQWMRRYSQPCCLYMTTLSWSQEAARTCLLAAVSQQQRYMEWRKTVRVCGGGRLWFLSLAILKYREAAAAIWWHCANSQCCFSAWQHRVTGSSSSPESFKPTYLRTSPDFACFDVMHWAGCSLNTANTCFSTAAELTAELAGQSRLHVTSLTGGE